ncbi:hypothetical protein VTH06DRAFT_6493 [Thermothelomyces fergusii]
MRLPRSCKAKRESSRNTLRYLMSIASSMPACSETSHPNRCPTNTPRSLTIRREGKAGPAGPNRQTSHHCQN